MPRIRGFTSEQKIDHQMKLLAERCDLLLYKNKISKSKVADYVGITPQAICRQFSKGHLTAEVVIAIATMTNEDPAKFGSMLVIE